MSLDRHPHPHNNFGPPRAGQHHANAGHGRTAERPPHHAPIMSLDMPRPQVYSKGQPRTNYARRSPEPPQSTNSYKTGGASKSNRWGPERPQMNADSTRESPHRSFTAERSSASTLRHADGVSGEGRKDDLRARHRGGTTTPSEHWEDDYDRSEEAPSPPVPSRTLPSGPAKNLYSKGPTESGAPQNINHQLAHDNPWADNGS